MVKHREQSSETNQLWPCLLTQYILGGKIADKSKVDKSGWYFFMAQMQWSLFYHSKWVSEYFRQDNFRRHGQKLRWSVHNQTAAKIYHGSARLNVWTTRTSSSKGSKFDFSLKYSETFEHCFQQSKQWRTFFLPSIDGKPLVTMIIA
jgi:hypothetical protein